MTFLAFPALAAALAAAAPAVSASDPVTLIEVEGQRPEISADRWTIAPDPALRHRYGPRPRAPLNGVTIRF